MLSLPRPQSKRLQWDDFDPSRVEQWFVNRQPFIHNFGSKLAYPSTKALPVLMHYGISGSGKTWLTRYLMWFVCPKAGFDAKDHGFPCAYIDFGNKPVAPREALAKLRIDLGRRYELKCLRFDLLWYYHHSRTSLAPIERPPRRVLPEEWDTIADLLEVVERFPVLDEVAKLVSTSGIGRSVVLSLNGFKNTWGLIGKTGWRQWSLGSWKTCCLRLWRLT
jgi:hypothetical protein